jgi:hypothetical protein
MHNSKAKGLLRNGRPLILTLSTTGPSYSIDGYGVVAAKFARLLTQPASDGPAQSDLFMVPNDDGLFPGCSQTWRALADTLAR